MPSLIVRLRPLAFLALLGAPACLPYTVGSTAETVPVGRTTNATSWYFIPNAFKSPGDTIAAPLAGVDKEWRHGLDERSDFGLRLTSGAGAVVNYKHRYQDYEGGRPALAYMVGAGVVNGGQHAHFEATLLASGDERSSMMPFGGLRAMQVVPISLGAAHDSPTIGGFAGLQMGDGSFTLRPELGVFYDRSTLGVRSNNIILVPAVTIQRRESRSSDQQLARPAMSATNNDEERRCFLVFCRSSPRSRTVRPAVMVTR